MAGKKKVRDEVKIDDEALDLMSDEEKAVLEAEVNETGELVADLDEEGMIKPKPDGKGETDEEKAAREAEEAERLKKEGDEKGGEKGDVKGEGEDDKTGDDKGKDGKKGKDRGGDDDDPLKDAKPVAVEVDGEKVAGWLGKSGKYIIPFSDVEKRDEARRTLRATNEVLKTNAIALEAQLKQLNADLERLKSSQGRVSTDGEKADQLDFKALGAKLYQSEGDAAEVLEQVFNAGRKAERAGAGEQRGSEEQTGEEAVGQVLTQEQMDRQIQLKTAFERGLEEIIEKHPQLKDPEIEFLVHSMGMRILSAKLTGMDQATQSMWCQVPENLLGVIKEATDNIVVKLGGAQPTDEEKAAERKVLREEILQDMTKKLNLNPEDVRTLGDVRESGGNLAKGDPDKELDELEGLELEAAVEKMSKEERDKYSESE